MAREARAATLYSVGPAEGPDHEATIRFGGKAPGRRAHSSDGIRAMGGIVSPPPRIVPGGLFAIARRADGIEYWSLKPFRLPIAARRPSALCRL